MSPARKAAEAAFTSRALSHVDEGDQPIVIVKRHRAAVVNDDVHAQGKVDEQQVEETRVPRIYRVETEPALPDGSSDPSSAIKSSDETSGRSDEQYAPQPVVQGKRRRRPRKNGEVTVIRPSRTDVARATSLRSNPGESSPVTAPASRSPEQGFDLDIATIRSRASARYASIMASIQKLEREATWKAEAAEAVRWIRQAIADYGLTAQDLGL